MEAKAILKFSRVGPRKVRGVVDLIRGKSAGDALNILKFSTRHAARVVAKLLQSAVANASEKKMGDVDLLWVSKATVDSGPTLKRMQPRARGRAFVIRKRMSHVLLVLSAREGSGSKAAIRARRQQKKEGA
jgi:large subunit ribosomal protein L22